MYFKSVIKVFYTKRNFILKKIFMHSSNKYIKNTYCVSSTVLGRKDQATILGRVVVNKTDGVPWSSFSNGGGHRQKKKKKIIADRNICYE